jgi:hypothetical protein
MKMLLLSVALTAAGAVTAPANTPFQVQVSGKGALSCSFRDSPRLRLLYGGRATLELVNREPDRVAAMVRLPV